MSETATGVSSHPAKKGHFSFHLIGSPTFDFFFFLAPFWTSILYLLLLYSFPGYQAVVFLVAYVFLAETHFASTWGVYLDPVNRQHFSKSRWIYFFIPAIILASSLMIGKLYGVKILFFISSLASAVHVTRQSTGIVALYRTKKEKADLKGRKMEEYALYLASAFFLGIGFIRFYLSGSGPLGKSFAWLTFFEGSLRILTAVLGLLALLFAGYVFFRDHRRYTSGEEVSFNKELVFFYSLFLYSPYCFVSRIEHAVALGVSIHYCQYLGIVWLLNRNKYPKAAASVVAPWDVKVLTALSHHLPLRLIYLLSYAGLMAILRQGNSGWNDFPESTWIYSFTIGLWIVHFYLDGFLWRFSNPFVRQTVAPYLKRTVTGS